MSFRKSLEPNQKLSKNKGFSLPKCFHLSGLTKSLFPCKSTPHRNNDNYVIFNYEKNSSELSNQPTTSTMIDTQEYHVYSSTATATSTQSINRFHVSDITTHPENDYYILQTDSEFNNDCHDDLEETRRSNNLSVSSISTYYNDYEDLTIVKHNNSPLTNYTSCHESDDSVTTVFDCLHSTKITTENCFQCDAPNTLSPLPNNKQSTLIHSPVFSPASTSSRVSQNQTNDSFQLQQQSYELETLIMGLSCILQNPNEYETHVCTSNYDATFVDDVSVQFADTVQVLRDNNDDWLYVQVSSDGRKGYIPKTIVVDLKQFIDQLKDHHSQLIQSSCLSSRN